MERPTQLASQILAAFKKRNQRKLRKLNDAVLRVTALQRDSTHFSLAIFSYILSKIVSKPRYLRPECNKCLEMIESSLEELVKKMDTATDAEMLSMFSKLENAVGCLEQTDARFVVDLVTKGKLKMAATFYAQGVSLGVAADMTGLDKQEILDYAGETMMFDRLKDEKSIAERMKMARQLLSD